MQYDYDTYEYHYKPIKPTQRLEEPDELLDEIAFPDYMLPKFLMMLLARTDEMLNRDITTISLSSTSDN